MHSWVKEQKKSTFTVPFLGPSGSTKNETAKSQNRQQRPTRATNKLDDGWPESAEEQGLLLVVVVWRHHITKQYVQDVLYAVEKRNQDDIAQVQDNSLHRKHFYTQKLLHIASFYTDNLLHREAFTDRRFYTQTLLHTDAFTHKALLHTDTFTHRRFYIQTVLHAGAFTHSCFYTDAFTHKASFFFPRAWPMSHCGSVLTWA